MRILSAQFFAMCIYKKSVGLKQKSHNFGRNCQYHTFLTFMWRVNSSNNKFSFLFNIIKHAF